MFRAVAPLLISFLFQSFIFVGTAPVFGDGGDGNALVPLTDFPPCESDPGPPNLTCNVQVIDMENGMFARLLGPSSCTDLIRMGSGFENFTVRFQVVSSDQSQVRFSGTEGACATPVTEAASCDFSDSPFFEFECFESRPGAENSKVVCPACVDVEQTFCFSNLTETTVDLRINNVNQCSNNALFTYSIALKSKSPTTIEGQDFYRIYMVDPTVIQEPNCPEDGC